MKKVYNIQNNYDNTSNPQQHNQPGFNPMEKLIEIVDKKDVLEAENRKLYEALLHAERKKNELLTEILQREKSLGNIYLQQWANSI